MGFLSDSLYGKYLLDIENFRTEFKNVSQAYYLDYTDISPIEKMCLNSPRETGGIVFLYPNFLILYCKLFLKLT
jgi:hypothetical protein